MAVALTMAMGMAVAVAVAKAVAMAISWPRWIGYKLFVQQEQGLGQGVESRVWKLHSAGTNSGWLYEG